MKRLCLLIGLLSAFWASAVAQDEPSVQWTVSTSYVEAGVVELLFKGRIAPDMHTYGINAELSPTSIEWTLIEGCTAEGPLYQLGKPEILDGDEVFYGTITIARKFRIQNKDAKVEGCITWQGCTDESCNLPEEYQFSVSIGNPAVASSSPTGTESANSTPIPDPSSDANEGGTGSTPLWALIVEAILWGFAMILTPCVFPMIPMTVSFFMKGSATKSEGRFKAFMYGLFIVLLYTVPICVIIGLTWLIGGESVSADIFNWLSTHWLPNLIFFAVFLVFALSFFGAFEITLPSSLVNKSDKGSDKKGLAGVFFMALTLVLVSFSCTGPIVGSVLIKSTQGEFWTPMVTMLAFSLAFALAFTLLAMFPTVLKSGPWLNSVKVVLGFVELAFGLKFLSVADQTYHWHLLDREIYLAIWIVIFSLLGLYLLGKIRFANDGPEPKHLSITRLMLSIAVFSFVVYLIPGMWGAPLKGISGFLPPLESQDFVLSRGASVNTAPTTHKGSGDLHFPLGLDGSFTLEEGLERAAAENKPLFVDITGHGCVNCREMESRVWSDPRVLKMLNEDFVLTALYTDDKTSLPQDKWLKTPEGKVLKDIGRVNSYIVRTRFGVNAQPNYAILDTAGKELVPLRGYNLDVEGFIAFLQSALDAFNKEL